MRKRAGRRRWRAGPSVLMGAALLALAIPSGGLSGGERRGTDIEAMREDGTTVKGELVAVRPAALVVREIRSESYLFLDVSDVTLVSIPKTSRGRGLLTGLIQGIFTGTITGDVVSPKAASTSRRWPWWIGGGLAGGGLGALLLGSVDVPTGEYETIPFAGRPKAELDAVLIRLRTLARIVDDR